MLVVSNTDIAKRGHPTNEVIVGRRVLAPPLTFRTIEKDQVHVSEHLEEMRYVIGTDIGPLNVRARAVQFLHELARAGLISDQCRLRFGVPIDGLHDLEPDSTPSDP